MLPCSNQVCLTSRPFNQIFDWLNHLKKLLSLPLLENNFYEDGRFILHTTIAPGPTHWKHTLHNVCGCSWSSREPQPSSYSCTGYALHLAEDQQEEGVGGNWNPAPTPWTRPSLLACGYIHLEKWASFSNLYKGAIWANSGLGGASGGLGKPIASDWRTQGLNLAFQDGWWRGKRKHAVIGNSQKGCYLRPTVKGDILFHLYS